MHLSSLVKGTCWSSESTIFVLDSVVSLAGGFPHDMGHRCGHTKTNENSPFETAGPNLWMKKEIWRRPKVQSSRKVESSAESADMFVIRRVSVGDADIDGFSTTDSERRKSCTKAINLVTLYFQGLTPLGLGILIPSCPTSSRYRLSAFYRARLILLIIRAFCMDHWSWRATLKGSWRTDDQETEDARRRWGLSTRLMEATWTACSRCPTATKDRFSRHTMP